MRQNSRNPCSLKSRKKYIDPYVNLREVWNLPEVVITVFNKRIFLVSTRSVGAAKDFRSMNRIIIFFLFGMCLLTGNLYPQNRYVYPWLENQPAKGYDRIGHIPLPEGYQRIPYPEQSFQDWLRYLPLKRDQQKVHLFDGRLKFNQNVHYRIIDMDVGKTDLQQCADAIMRLYAEYLYSQGRYDEIAFNFTNGDRARFSRWSEGFRPVVRGNQSTWRKTAAFDLSYANFRKYLNIVFSYAGSYSLSQELEHVDDAGELQAGDVFIEGGHPGHGVIVVDAAVHPETQEKIFLIAQSYMPAQEIHILKNPNDAALNPWYSVDAPSGLNTPQWPFQWEDLKRFKGL